MLCFLFAVTGVSWFGWSVYTTWCWVRLAKKNKQLIADNAKLASLVPRHDAKGRFKKR